MNPIQTADETIARLTPLTDKQKAFVYEHERRHSEMRLRNRETDFLINSKLEEREP
jgi:hypothetical protein